MYNLRPYQVEAADVILTTKEGEKTLIVLPTASGKTVIFSSVTAQTKGRVLILVPNQELREQSIEKIKRLDSSIDVGSVQGQVFEDYHSKVVVGTWQSIGRKGSGDKRINEMLQHGEFEMIIIDEVHNAVDQYKKIISKLNKNIKVIGLTATPWNKKLVSMFGKPKYSKTIVEMISDEYLCDVKCFQVATDTDLSSVGISNGDFKENELDEAINNEERNEIIVKAYKEYAEGDRLSTLVFANSKAHIRSIVELFNEHGIYAKGLDSDNDKEYRKNVIEEFRLGKLPVLVNCGILTTGFDYERLDALILARPTRSKILYTQCLGRGLRLHEEKEDCLVIDIVDIARQHDICDVSSIFEVKIAVGETFKKAKEREEEEKKQETERKQREEERKLEAERKKIEELKLKTERINLFNTYLSNTFENNEYDWWKVNVVTYALSYRSNHHYVVEQMNEMYHLYHSITERDTREIKLIKSSDDLNEIVDYVHNEKLSLFSKKNLFTERDAEFKMKSATPEQLKYVRFAKTNWDVQKHFGSIAITNQIKENKLYHVL